MITITLQIRYMRCYRERGRQRRNSGDVDDGARLGLVLVMTTPYNRGWGGLGDFSPSVIEEVGGRGGAWRPMKGDDATDGAREGSLLTKERRTSGTLGGQGRH
jgi:hypothetical protein